MSRHYKGT